MKTAPAIFLFLERAFPSRLNSFKDLAITLKEYPASVARSILDGLTNDDEQRAPTDEDRCTRLRKHREFFRHGLRAHIQVQTPTEGPNYPGRYPRKGR